MSVPLIVNGVTFQYPQEFDKHWGPTLTAWSTAVTNALQQTSNNFTLLTNHSIIFKDSEGTPKSLTLTIPSPLTATYTLTLPPNAGSSGQVLRTDGSGTTTWVNAAGGGTVNTGTTGQLAYYPGNAAIISGETMSGDATIAVGGVLTIANSAITDAKVSSSAAIALSKLASTTAYAWYVANGAGVLTPITVTTSKAVATDANGLPIASTTTATELSHVAGVTSPIQTQIDSKVAKSGDTMSGTLNMGSNKIISLANGTSISDAANIGQLNLNAAGYIIGTIVQTVQFTSSATTTTVNTSYQSTALAATITPKATTHKVKISVTGTLTGLNLSGNHSYASIFSGTTDLSNGNGFVSMFGDTAISVTVPCAMTYLDSPATVSTFTYTVKIKSGDIAGDTIWNQLGGTAVILLEEIAA